MTLQDIIAQMARSEWGPPLPEMQDVGPSYGATLPRSRMGIYQPEFVPEREPTIPVGIARALSREDRSFAEDGAMDGVYGYLSRLDPPSPHQLGLGPGDRDFRASAITSSGLQLLKVLGSRLGGGDEKETQKDQGFNASMGATAAARNERNIAASDAARKLALHRQDQIRERVRKADQERPPRPARPVVSLTDRLRYDKEKAGIQADKEVTVAKERARLRPPRATRDIDLPPLAKRSVAAAQKRMSDAAIERGKNSQEYAKAVRGYASALSKGILRSLSDTTRVSTPAHLMEISEQIEEFPELMMFPDLKESLFAAIDSAGARVSRGRVR